VQTLPLSSLRPAYKWLQPLSLAAALILVLVAPNLGWADSCSTVSLSLHGQPVMCTIPEQTPELALTVTLTGLSLTAQAQGMVLIYDDSTHTVLSDVVTFTNVGGVATVTFLSDTEGVLLTPPGLPILGQFSEGRGPAFISLALGNGNFLDARICSDTENPNCVGGSDSIRLSESTTAIPEPGTFVLLASGLFGSGALKVSASSLRRRLLTRTLSQPRA
jgi:PEP-CTERM motif